MRTQGGGYIMRTRRRVHHENPGRRAHHENAGRRAHHENAGGGHIMRTQEEGTS